MDLASWGSYQFEYFILVFFRMIGLTIMAPFFGSDAMPWKVKIFFSLVMAAVVFPMVSHYPAVMPGSLPGMIFAVGVETAVGFIIGFAATLLMTAVQLGGHWVGQQVGLTLANVIDPVSNSRISIMEQFKYILLIIVFMCLNGHHYLLKALVATFKTVPVAAFVPGNKLCNYIVGDMGQEMFVFAAKLGAPFIVALLMVTVAMGFVAKTVPEVNIFIIGFGLRIVIGFGMLLVLLPFLVGVFESIIGAIATDIDFITTELMVNMAK